MWPQNIILPEVVQYIQDEKNRCEEQNKDLLWVEGALPALTELFQNHLKLDRRGDVRLIECTLTVPTLNGPTQVYLRMPISVDMGE